MVRSLLPGPVAAANAQDVGGNQGDDELVKRVRALTSGDKVAVAFSLHPTSLDDLFAGADVVTLHVPATSGTVRLISDREFALMKPGAVLINTARGNIVDIEALVRALADRKLRAAGLDVLPQEPLIREEAAIFRAGVFREAEDFKALVANHVLLRFPNVIVTPHNAYNTEAALQRIIETTLSNIEAFSRGTPQNVVSLS
jgi:D-lactate dehydrogenase